MNEIKAAQATQDAGQTQLEQANWLAAAGSLLAAGVQWRDARQMREAAKCLRKAAKALGRAAEEFGLGADEQERERRIRPYAGAGR